MKNSYSDDRIRLAARLYYIDGMGQGEVARFVKVSQAKVSRLLALARERGIVRISVADYEPRNHEMEGQLRASFQLSTAIVIKALEGMDGADLRRAVGHFSAPAVEGMIQREDVVALAGGRTIYEVVHHLPEVRNKSVTVVQAMGTVDSSVSPFDAQEVGRVMAQRLGGVFHSLNAPVHIADKRLRDALLKQEQVSAVHRHLSRATIAFVGIGTLENSVFVERSVLAPKDVAELRAAGAVGEICGRFFDKDGRECNTRWRDHVISAEVAQLRRIPKVIGVVSGSDRGEAVRAAINGGILKGLVIDEEGARSLLAAAVPTRRRPATKAAG